MHEFPTKSTAKSAHTKRKLSTQQLSVMAMFAAVLCVSAYISIPLPLAGHITMLNFVITLIALVFPSSQALLITIVWILLGAVGLPVYIGGNAGIGYLVSSLGGYTVSFLFVTALVPVLCGKNYHRIRYTAVAILSVIFVDLFGMVWLHQSSGMSWRTAWIAGFFSFILLDLIKAVIAAQIAPAFRRLLPDTAGQDRG